MRSSPKTYLIGRSPQADIVLDDATVSRQHAELVMGRDGTWYLIDRNSTGGTCLWSGANWVPIKQTFVRQGDRLKFAAFECSVDDLLRQIPDAGGAASGPPGDGSGQGTPMRDDRPAGPVRRDPATGEIVSTGDE